MALNIFLTEIWIFYAIAVAFTGLRVFARVRAVGWRGFQADDYLAFGAIVSSIEETCQLFSIINHVTAILYRPGRRGLSWSLPILFDYRQEPFRAPACAGAKLPCHGNPVRDRQTKGARIG